MSCLVVSATRLRAELLSGLLAQCAPVTIADSCDSVEGALAAIDRCRPRLVILDRDGENDDCERIARHLLAVCAGARLILLSCDPRLDPLRRELAPVMNSSESWQALIRSVRAIPDASDGDRGQVDPLPDVACFDSLRPREHSVLALLGSGLGSREIAGSLGVSLQTIETYRKSISVKLGVSRSRLVRIAVLYRCVYLGRVSCPLPGLEHREPV